MARRIGIMIHEEEEEVGVEEEKEGMGAAEENDKCDLGVAERSAGAAPPWSRHLRWSSGERV